MLDRPVSSVDRIVGLLKGALPDPNEDPPQNDRLVKLICMLDICVATKSNIAEIGAVITSSELEEAFDQVRETCPFIRPPTLKNTFATSAIDMELIKMCQSISATGLIMQETSVRQGTDPGAWKLLFYTVDSHVFSVIEAGVVFQSH